MTKSKNVAFFAPIKPPDHPIPSGDRLIARNLIKAMELGGNKVRLASKFICYSKRSGTEYLQARKEGALKEAKRLCQRYEKLLERNRPQVWVTYHPYCKAPDWIGPIVAKHLGIPYVTIEAARTGQGGEEDEWKPWREEAQAGIVRADLHMVFKPSDRYYLEGLDDPSKLRDLAPFVDTQDLLGEETHPLPDHWRNEEAPILVTAGMMRKGKKDQNFYMLASMLSGMQDLPWNLIVIGGGPEEGAIKAAFGSIEPERIHWTGQIDHQTVLQWMRAGDLFVWPGWKEPIGMVYLEAQAQGLPIVAYESMGVPLVVGHGETGLLAQEGDVHEFQENIIHLLNEPDERLRMGHAAKDSVITRHSLQAAADTLNQAFDELV